ncbi:MAG: DMT family transporter [Pigmentiphaga sp.]|nr:DMT family transporter [Pigmentiphaga sp.]
MQALWMLASTLMFGIMGASIKMASEYHVTLAEIILMRGLPSVALLLFWARASGLSLRPLRWRPHFWRNVSGTGAMWLGFYAVSQLPLATATTLTYTAPLFIAGYMLGWGGARRDGLRIFAVALGFAGVLAVLRPAINPEQWLAALCGLGAGACGALSQLQIRSLGRLGEPAWRVVLYFSVCTCLSGALVLLVQGWHMPSLRGWLALAVLGLTGLGGQLALTRAFGAGSALLSAALQYTIIIVASVLGFLLWGDRPDAMAAAGMGLIVGASLLSVWCTMRGNHKL